MIFHYGSPPPPSSLVINEIEHFSMNSSTICTRIFVKCLFKSFDNFYCIVCLLILKLRSSLYISGHRLFVSYTCCKYFLPASHFIFLTMSFKEQTFYILLSSMSMYSIIILPLLLYLKSGNQIMQFSRFACFFFSFQTYFVYSRSFAFSYKFGGKFGKFVKDACCNFYFDQFVEN